MNFVDNGDGERRAVVVADTGEPIEIGPAEKMSKSKKQHRRSGRTLTSIMAPTPRAGSCSPNSPPERDVLWTEEAYKALGGSIQRLWRLVDEADPQGAAKGAKRPTMFSPEADELRRAAHRASKAVEPEHRGAALQHRHCGNLRSRQ